VSIKHKLRTMILCLPLVLGALSGIAMRPEEIEELMHSMNQQKISYTIPGESGKDDAAIPRQSDEEP
jgi:hypothetical protein